MNRGRQGRRRRYDAAALRTAASRSPRRLLISRRRFHRHRRSEVDAGCPSYAATKTPAWSSYAANLRLRAWPSPSHLRGGRDERVLFYGQQNTMLFDDALDTAPFKVRIELMGRICWV